MDLADITAIWVSLAWIALAFGAAWLLNLVAEHDSAASEPDQPEKTHIPGTSP
jgi:hypothetical protein